MRPYSKIVKIDTLENKLMNIRDLSDFCQKWPSLRSLFLSDNFDESLEKDDVKHVVEWLVLLADRVCLEDVT